MEFASFFFHAFKEHYQDRALKGARLLERQLQYRAAAPVLLNSDNSAIARLPSLHVSHPFPSSLPLHFSLHPALSLSPVLSPSFFEQGLGGFCNYF